MVDFETDRYVQSILTVDNIAHRYKMLPSEVLEKGTSFDLYVIDISSRYQAYQHDKAEGNAPKSGMPTQADMIEMIRRAREEE